jgi:hypothetical protein
MMGYDRSWALSDRGRGREDGKDGSPRPADDQENGVAAGKGPSFSELAQIGRFRQDAVVSGSRPAGRVGAVNPGTTHIWIVRGTYFPIFCNGSILGAHLYGDGFRIAAKRIGAGN